MLWTRVLNQANKENNMKKILIIVSALIITVGLNGCASTSSPSVGTNGFYNDKTLNNNTVDFFTLLRVQNNYGTQTTTSGAK